MRVSAGDARASMFSNPGRTHKIEDFLAINVVMVALSSINGLFKSRAFDNRSSSDKEQYPIKTSSEGESSNREKALSRARTISN